VDRSKKLFPICPDRTPNAVTKEKAAEIAADFMTTMGRAKRFTREAVLEKALPVFWRRGFADAGLS
jgi:hypothetical protein